MFNAITYHTVNSRWRVMESHHDTSLSGKARALWDVLAMPTAGKLVALLAALVLVVARTAWRDRVPFVPCSRPTQPSWHRSPAPPS
ncbi:hypothetical protein ACSRUE_06785 [Sorangium sp. KYC3313]|uniref:hypothetical protein n=1 Tax=Sorangium sp. KYC3313 TaxID=3449740 RepID=UPI003F88FF80